MMLFIKPLRSMCRQELPDAALTSFSMSRLHLIWSAPRIEHGESVRAGHPHNCWLLVEIFIHLVSVGHDTETVRPDGYLAKRRDTESWICISFWGNFWINWRMREVEDRSDHSSCCSVLCCGLCVRLLWCSLLWLQRFNYGWMPPRAFIISRWTKWRRVRDVVIFSPRLWRSALNCGFRWSKFCWWFSTGEQTCFMLDRWENPIRSDEWSHSLSLCLCFSVIKSLCACLAELAYKRMVLQQPGKENLSKIISFHRITGSFKCFTS